MKQLVFGNNCWFYNHLLLCCLANEQQLIGQSTGFDLNLFDRGFYGFVHWINTNKLKSLTRLAFSRSNSIRWLCGDVIGGSVQKTHKRFNGVHLLDKPPSAFHFTPTRNYRAIIKMHDFSISFPQLFIIWLGFFEPQSIRNQ